MKRISAVIVMILASSAWAGTGGQAQSQQGTCLQDPQGTGSQNGTCLLDQPLAELSEAEAATLSFMREEEKMARDVYLTLYDVWQTPIFTNISKAEQQHTDRIKSLLDSYGLPDPALEDVGMFANQDIQALYDYLVEIGSASLIEALRAGALIEEVDIEDLQHAIAETENPALERVYTNLMMGSYNHLRAFVGNIEYLGYVYEAQSLPQDEVDDILNADNSQSAATNAQFQPSIMTQRGLQGNGAILDQSDEVTIVVTFQPDTDHLGQKADLLVVATFTPAGTTQQLMFMRDDTGGWQNWNGDFNTLTAAEVQQALRKNYRLNVYQGSLPAGRYQISGGYRLQDGTMRINEQAIDFYVE